MKNRESSVKDVLFGTKRRVLAFAAAVGTVASAIGGVLALLPKSPEALDASFASITAYPEVSLEEYDARSSPQGVVEGSPTPAKTGMVPYRLAADTTTVPPSISTSQEGTSSIPTTTSGTPTTTTGTSATTTSTSTKPSDTSSATSTLTTGTSTSKSKGPRTANTRRRRARRPGGRITTTTPNLPYPTQNSAPQESAILAPPPQSFHEVQGAHVTEGTGAPESKVAAVVRALSQVKAPEPETRAANAEGEAATTTTTPTLPPTGSAPAPASETASASAHVVLPRKCQSLCGATQEIDKALTYDPNPVKAAEAVAAVFNDSRAEIVGRRLYPIGAMISYTINLDGFAHRKATLEWSLLASASRRALPRRWWLDVVVAHIEPTVNHESLSGTFWVPVPPERGDYLVHLVLLDSSGVPHASSDSTPAFH